MPEGAKCFGFRWVALGSGVWRAKDTAELYIKAQKKISGEEKEGRAGGRCMQSAEQKKTYWLPRGSGETGGSRGPQDSLWEEEEGIMQCEGYSEEDGVEHRICS